MSYVIILLVILAMGAVVFTLVRGLIAFLRTTEADLKGEGTATDMHAMQNKMMFARVKYQAIAVLLLVLLSIIAASN